MSKVSSFDYANAASDDLVVHMMHKYVPHTRFDEITPEAHMAVLDLIVALTCAVDNSERGWAVMTKDFAVAPEPEPEPTPEVSFPLHDPDYFDKKYAKLTADMDFADRRVMDSNRALGHAKLFRSRAKKALVKFFAMHHRAFTYTGVYKFGK